MLVQWLNFDFGGNVLAKVEHIEKSITECSRKTTDEFPICIMIGTFISRCGDDWFRKRLIFHGGRLTVWPEFKEDVCASAPPLHNYMGAGSYGHRRVSKGRRNR